MHEVAPNQLTEEIPASVKSPRPRLQYPLLPEDFFRFLMRPSYQYRAFCSSQNGIHI